MREEGGDNHPFQDCETYDDILKRIEDFQIQRKDLPEAYFDGENKKFKKFLFLFQVIFPVVVCIYFLIQLVKLEVETNANFNIKLMEKIYLDWGGDFKTLGSNSVFTEQDQSKLKEQLVTQFDGVNDKQHDIHISFNPIFNVSVAWQYRKNSKHIKCSLKNFYYHHREYKQLLDSKKKMTMSQRTKWFHMQQQTWNGLLHGCSCAVEKTREVHVTNASNTNPGTPITNEGLLNGTKSNTTTEIGKNSTLNLARAVGGNSTLGNQTTVNGSII